VGWHSLVSYTRRGPPRPRPPRVHLVGRHSLVSYTRLAATPQNQSTCCPTNERSGKLVAGTPSRIQQGSASAAIAFVLAALGSFHHCGNGRGRGRAAHRDNARSVSDPNAVETGRPPEPQPRAGMPRRPPPEVPEGRMRRTRIAWPGTRTVVRGLHGQSRTKSGRPLGSLGFIVTNSCLCSRQTPPGLRFGPHAFGLFGLPTSDAQRRSFCRRSPKGCSTAGIAVSAERSARHISALVARQRRWQTASSYCIAFKDRREGLAKFSAASLTRAKHLSKNNSII